MVKLLTRGGQTISQSINMFGQVFALVLVTNILIFLLCSSLSLYVRTNTNEANLASRYCLYKLETAIDPYFGYIAHSNQLVNYQGRKLSKASFIKLLDMQGVPQQYKSKILQSIGFGLVCAIFTLLLQIIYLQGKGKNLSRDKYIRGATLEDVDTVNKIIKQKYSLSKVKIGDVHLNGNSERQHISIYGSTGTGKSQIYFNLFNQIHKQGDRYVAYDPCQEFIPRFYQPEKDVILNFFDARCPYWDPWLECKKRSDFDALAESLMPEQGHGRDPFWVYAARIVFASVCYALGKKRNPTIKELMQVLFAVDDQYVKQLIKNTDANIIINEAQGKLALSVKAMLATFLRSFKYLPETGNKFSIREWVNDLSHPGNIFISTSSREEASMRPLITTIIDQASISAREIPAYPDRNLYFILEERHTLGKLSSSLATKALGRKHGLCFVSGWQSVAQQRGIYGQDDLDAMMDLCNTTVIGRMKSRNSAKYMAEFLGETELEIMQEAISYGITDNRSGINLARQTQIRPLVLPSEIQKLDDLEFYVSLKGNLPVAKIKIKLDDYPIQHAGFMERSCPQDEELEYIFTETIREAKAKGAYVEIKRDILPDSIDEPEKNEITDLELSEELID